MAEINIIETAKTALAEKRYANAIELLNNVLSESPDNTQTLSMLGAAYAETKDYSHALIYFYKALNCAPSARNHFNIATVHKLQDNQEQAEISLRAALALDPEYQRAKTMLSDIKTTTTQVVRPPISIAPEPVELAGQTAQSSSTSQGAGPTVTPQFPHSSTGSSFGPQVDQPNIIPQKNRKKIAPGGLMVVLEGLILWSGWTSFISSFTGSLIAGIVVGLGFVIIFGKWLAANAGAFETHHWIIMIFLTGLIPSLLMIKGFDLLAQGYYEC